MTVPPVPHRLQPGEAVLNYRVLRELGSRAAPLYAVARTVGERRELAVVQVFRRARDGTSQLTGILRDARALAEVDHPNLMRVHGVEPLGEEIVVASEFIEGESYGGLRTLARTSATPISLEAHLRVVLDVIAGLGALHNTLDARRRTIGLFHGLLSPADVIVGIDGVARVVGVFHSQPLRLPQDMMPNVGYFAPEVLLGDRAVDARADIYGAGVMLWEALAGKRLFPGMGEAQIVARHLRGALDRPDIAEEERWAAPLVDVAQRALATDPKARFESPEQMAAAIAPHARAASQTTVAVLVRRLAGDLLSRFRAELDSERSEAEQADDTLTTEAPEAPTSPASAAHVHVARAQSSPPGSSAAGSPSATSDDSVVTALAPVPPELLDDSTTASRPPVMASSDEEARASSASRSLPPLKPPRSSGRLPIIVAPPPVVRSTPRSSSPPAALSLSSSSSAPTEADAEDPSVTKPGRSEADAEDPSVTKPARSDMPNLAPPEEEEEDEDAQTVTREVSVTRDLQMNDSQANEIETITRKLESIAAEVSLEAAMDDDDDDGSELVTEIAPVQVVIPTTDESVTQDRPPVAAPSSRALPSAPPPEVSPVPPLPAFSSSEITEEPPVLPQVAAAAPEPREAIGPKEPAPATHAPVNYPAPVFEEEAPPSYKALGIVLGFAFVGALALLVYVIVRAAGDGSTLDAARSGPGPSAEVRVKAKHAVTFQADDDALASGAKRAADAPVTPASRRVPPHPPPRR